MTQEELTHLFDAAIAAVAAVQRARQAEADHARIPAPERPKVVTDLQQWDDYVADRDFYTREHDRLEAARANAEQAERDIRKRLMSVIPIELWFHHTHAGREVAIGIAYDDWGGSHYTIEIKDWPADPDTLPSLAPRYRGD